MDGPDRFHAARTRRRTYIGEDRDTQFYKAVDSMVCPYGYGESLHYGMTPYVFDFTGDPGKDYNDVYEKQIKSSVIGSTTVSLWTIMTWVLFTAFPAWQLISSREMSLQRRQPFWQRTT